MTEVRLIVERDGAACCPRCVATVGYDAAPDLRPPQEHELPTGAIRGPRPLTEAVRTVGYYCDEHDVLLPITYNAALDTDAFYDESGKWIAIPIETLLKNPFAVAVPLADMTAEPP